MNEADMKNCVNVLLGKYREVISAGLFDVVIFSYKPNLNCGASSAKISFLLLLITLCRMPISAVCLKLWSYATQVSIITFTSC